MSNAKIEDRAEILARIKYQACVSGAAPVCEPITPEHLSQCAEAGPRAVLASIGPLHNVDRLAHDQQLRFSPNGVTLIYGENGSGKSGYARIAKRICRSLSSDELRGDVFSHQSTASMRVKLRFQLGDTEISELDWTPDTKPPAALKQISVFDNQNARLYVDQQNRIAYLPVEIAILEYLGELYRTFGDDFSRQKVEIDKRLRVSLPVGYSKGGALQSLLDQLDAKFKTFPTKERFEKLAAITEAEREELISLERKLAQDPVAQAATRKRAVQLLTRIITIFRDLEVGLSDGVAAGLATLAQNARTAALAVELAATQQFSAEPLNSVGGDAWRLMYTAARDFAALSGGPTDKIADQLGATCPLCQEPLMGAAAARMTRFNAFVQSEATNYADTASKALEEARKALNELTLPAIDNVIPSLIGYEGLDAHRKERVENIRETLTSYRARQISLLESIVQPQQELAELPASQISMLAADIEKLESEALQLEAAATRDASLDTDRARVAELKDRAKLQNDLSIVIQRLDDCLELAAIKACQEQVQTRPISDQISALRRKLVTENLQNRIQDEITKFDLEHIPFRISDTSERGQSLVSVGLKGVGRVPNNQILSDGEQRALALACFLAEIDDNGEGHGLVIDDPVSSLDQRRIRRVAQRLIEEASKGRQVIVFTHNLVFFNEMVAEAARIGDAAPLIKMVIRKTES